LALQKLWNALVYLLEHYDLSRDLGFVLWEAMSRKKKPYSIL
jgi:hypothetical protein